MLFERKTNVYCTARAHIKRVKRTRIVGMGASLALILLSLLAVFPITKQTEKAEATATASTTTLAITSSSTTASVDVTPVSSNGTFAASATADEVAFTVTTDNVTGYSLTIAGSDNTRQLNNTDAAATLDSITAATDASTFATGAAATYSNKWGYKPSFYNSAANTNYLQAPTTTAESLNITDAANGADTTCTDPADTSCSLHAYTIGIGTRVDYTKPVGTYSNTFVIEAVPNNVAYQINYLDSTGDTIGNMPAAEGSSVATVSAFTLDTKVPTRTGYTFQGWCYGTVDHTTSPSACTGTVKAAGDPFDFNSYSSTSTNTADLYAMWKTDKLYLQNMTASQCTTAGVTAYDSRDEEAYLVKKLADGKCWITENLRLDISDATVKTKLTSATTNATDTILGYLKNGGGSSPYPASGVSTSWADSYNLPYINTTYKNTTQAASGSAPAGKIGVYYNYCAASAGSYCYASGAGSGNASYDICPKGWRMPTGGSSGEYQALYTAYSSNVANFESALSTPLSGYFYSGSARNQGTLGYFWSSTIYNTNGMYRLVVGASAVYPQDYYNRNYGFSVRCVLQ